MSTAETAPSPFTEVTDPHADTFAPTQVILVPERAEFVPSFYRPHRGPEKIQVKQDGHALLPMFTVADVPPERRWAINGAGNVLAQDDFRERYIAKCREWFTTASPEARSGKGGVPNSWSEEYAYVPSVLDYVKVKVSKTDSRKVVPIDYDPDRTKGAIPDTLYDATGEHAYEGSKRLDSLIDAYRHPVHRKRMLPREVDEVEEHFKANGVDPEGAIDPIKAKIDLLTQMQQDGEITVEQFADKVQRLISGPPKEKEKPKPKPGYRLARCGEESVYYAKMEAHEAQCEKCQEVIENESPTEGEESDKE